MNGTGAPKKLALCMGGFEHKASYLFPIFIPDFTASMKKVTVGEVKNGITKELTKQPIDWKKIL